MVCLKGSWGDMMAMREPQGPEHHVSKSFCLLRRPMQVSFHKDKCCTEVDESRFGPSGGG